MPQRYAQVLTISNYVFTGLFSLEMALKLFALGFFEYIADSFNLFDGVVVILSVVEIILDVSNCLHLQHCFAIKIAHMTHNIVIQEDKQMTMEDS